MSALGAILLAASGGGGEPSSTQSLSAVDVALLVSTVGSIALFGGAAALALGWAFKSGQFENFDRGAKSIFGPDEPIGEPTDAFPDAKPLVEEDEPTW